MATYRKRGDSYQIRVYAGRDKDGKDLYKSTTFRPDPGMNEKQVERALKKAMADFERRVQTGEILDGRTTFEELVETWFKEIAPQTIVQNTADNYRLLLNLYVLPAIGHRRLSQLTPQVIQELVNQLSQQGKKDGSGLSKASVRNTMAVVSVILDTARKWKLIPENPCRDVSLPREKAARKIKYFTPEQARIFLDALDAPIVTECPERTRHKKDGSTYTVRACRRISYLPLSTKCFLYVMMFTGARREEILPLTWKDFDADARTLVINKTTTVTATGVVTADNTKNPTSTRTITVHPVVCDMLQAWKAEQAEYCASMGTAWKGVKSSRLDESVIFTNPDGLPLYPGTPYRQFVKIIKRYNEGHPEAPLPLIPLHGLRHTSVTVSLAAGVDPQIVAERHGHKTTRTTLDIYGHVLRSMEQEAANTMGEYLLGAGKNKKKKKGLA